MSELTNYQRKLLQAAPVTFVGRDRREAQALVASGFLVVDSGVYKRTKAGNAALAQAAEAVGKSVPKSTNKSPA